MKYFKDIDNEIYADPINVEGLTEITRAEVDVILAPTPEEALALMIQQGEHVVEAHIQEPITAYNLKFGLKFSDAHSCKSYSDHPTYTHAAFCVDAWEFNVQVWDTARALLESILAAGEPYPNDVEFKAMLPSQQTLLDAYGLVL